MSSLWHVSFGKRKGIYPKGHKPLSWGPWFKDRARKRKERARSAERGKRYWSDQPDWRPKIECRLPGMGNHFLRPDA